MNSCHAAATDAAAAGVPLPVQHCCKGRQGVRTVCSQPNEGECKHTGLLLLCKVLLRMELKVSLRIEQLPIVIDMASCLQEYKYALAHMDIAYTDACAQQHTHTYVTNSNAV